MGKLYFFNNVFSDISDCELVEASQLVEELVCSYSSDVELVSASQNVEDSLTVSGENETLFWLHWRGSTISQGRLSNPSERGTAPSNYFDPCYRNQTMFLALEEIVGAGRSHDI